MTAQHDRIMERLLRYADHNTEMQVRSARQRDALVAAGIGVDDDDITMGRAAVRAALSNLVYNSDRAALIALAAITREDYLESLDAEIASNAGQQQDRVTERTEVGDDPVPEAAPR